MSFLQNRIRTGKHLFAIVFTLITMCGTQTDIFAQLSGTYTVGTGKTYATIAAAITALNTSGVSGPVTFNVTAGHTETFSSPTAGTITATGTAANTITFQKSGAGANPLITAGVGVSLQTDGIIKIAGGDYITFDGIDLRDNPANTSSTTIMEWGYALVKKQSSAPINGCQNITIKNCAVTMSQLSGSNMIGVYANNHTATSTVGLTAASDADILLNIVIDNVTVSLCATGINIGGYSGNTSLYNRNIEIKNCVIRDCSNGIFFRYNRDFVCYNNTITNTTAVSGFPTGNSTGIQNSTNSTNIVIRNNRITMKKGSTANWSTGIDNTSSGTLTISGNIIEDFVAQGSSQSIYMISITTSTATNIILDSNVIQNCTSLNTSGAIYGISLSSGAFDTLFLRNNIIRNLSRDTTVTTSSPMAGISQVVTCSTGVQLIENNTFYQISSYSSGAVMGIWSTNSRGQQILVNNNVIRKLSAGSGGVYGARLSGANGTSLFSSNTVDSLSASGIVYGLVITTPSSPCSFSRNIITNLSSTNSNVQGLLNSGSTSDTAAVIEGNILYGLRALGGGATVGISSTGFFGSKIYNNFIHGLYAPLSTSSNGILGISLSIPALTDTIKLYYNTVYLDGSSTSQGFGSAAFSAYVPASVIDVRNNIFVNMSTAGNGSTDAKTVAFRLYNSLMTNHSLLSDNNLYYVNPATTGKALFTTGTNFDSTLCTLKKRLTPRDRNSVSELPPFINTSSFPYNLHLNASIATYTEGRGKPVTYPAVVVDYDGQTRNATAPDIGADEFNGTPLADVYSSVLKLTALIEGLYNATGNSMMADSMKVYLHRSAAPYTVVDSATQVLSASGQGTYIFNRQMVDSAYYLRVYNRRTLETWSNGALVFGCDTTYYDFSTAANMAYGNNQALKGSRYCIYSGDVNQDGVIDLSDLLVVDNDNANFVTGNVLSDLNGDEVVDLTDLLVVDNNNANFVARAIPLSGKRPGKQTGETVRPVYGGKNSVR